MSKYKAGLHKEVSAIFNSVSLPKNDISHQSPAAPAPGHQDHSAPKPPAIASPAPASPAPASPAPKPTVAEPSSPKPPALEPAAPKPRAPSHMTPTKPKPQQPPPQPPKETPAKQPKAKTAIKAARQAPWQRTLEQVKSKLFASRSGVSATKQKVTVIAVPVLFIILIFVFVRAFSSPSRKITGAGTSKLVKAAAAADTKVEWKIPEPYPTTLRDPMQFGPATTEAGQTDTSGLIVKGIVYSKNNPCAVVCDQIVHEGDKILGVVIVKINENSVEFEVNGKKWTQRVQR